MLIVYVYTYVWCWNKGNVQLMAAILKKNLFYGKICAMCVHQYSEVNFIWKRNLIEKYDLISIWMQQWHQILSFSALFFPFTMHQMNKFQREGTKFGKIYPAGSQNHVSVRIELKNATFFFCHNPKKFANAFIKTMLQLIFVAKINWTGFLSLTFFGKINY